MALSNYTELKTSIADWLHMNEITSVIPDFIRLTESFLNNQLTILELESTATSDTESGDNTLAIPSDFGALRSLSYSDGGNAIVLESWPLPELIARYGETETGKPKSYSLYGTNFILAPVPDGAYTIKARYQSVIPALSSSNPTNVALTNYPELYLYGGLFYAGQYIRDADIIQFAGTEFQNGIKRVNQANWGLMSPMTIKQG